MTLPSTASVVMQINPAAPAVSQQHFAQKLSFETDCADVELAIRTGTVDFCLLDVRGANAYQLAHLPGALHLPRGQISATVLQELKPQRGFVVYCAGPHCNGADKAAEKIAALGFAVKIMIGGVTGWRDEGFRLIEPTAQQLNME